MILPFLASLIFLIVSIFLFLKLVSKHDSLIKKHKPISLFISFTNIAVLAPAFYLLLLSRKYANYLYSNFGFIKEHLVFFAFVSIITSLLFLFLSYEKLLTYFVDKHFFDILSRFEKWEFFNLSISLIVLSLFFYLSFTTVLGISSKMRYDSSYVNKFGRDYYYINFLSDYVPKDGVVIHPPQLEAFWPSIGNQAVVRYFLFPRKLVSGDYLERSFINGVGDFYYFVYIPSVGNIPEWPIIKSDEKKISFDNGDSFVSYVKLEEIEGSEGVFRIHFK
ncbi:MAG: hypothetical protein NC918_07380 [Candidatus Omnitrophica bacterium]|nr:hypothetical protein [Candidatus Omnitrophota bacterium]